MGSHDLAQNGPTGSFGNGTASSYNRDALVKRSSDAIPREEFSPIPETDSVSQGFPHTEIVPVTSAEDPANYFSSLLEPGGMESTKRQEVDNHDMASARTTKAVTIGDHALPSLRVVLSDPLTGDLMEDATILPCGHSFGSGGIYHVLESNACITCGVQVSREVLAPNYALQAAVQAYKREEENPKPRKRPSERFVQDQFVIADQPTSEAVRLRLIQFPFSVGDRVMIKGNKRTPDRFVSREAVITAQCLNGWYVVRTSDNGETVKLQYRSLMKVGGPQ